MKKTLTERHGFSLMEVLIAMAVITIGVAAVVATLAYGTRSSHSGTRITEATNLGRLFLEQMQGATMLDTVSDELLVDGWPGPASGLNDDPQDRRALNEAPYGGMTIAPGLTGLYKRNIQSERLSNDADSHEYHLARVLVTVYWNEGGVEHATELRALVRHSLP